VHGRYQQTHRTEKKREGAVKKMPQIWNGVGGTGDVGLVEKSSEAYFAQT